MNPYLIALIMGLVEGLTEFLPISSTGHLIIAGQLLHFTGEKAKIFEVVIQLGAILAVVGLYWNRFWGLIVPQKENRFSGPRGIWLLLLTTIPASVLGLFTHTWIKTYLFNTHTVAWALGIGALLILIVERLPTKNKFFSLDEMTPSLALGIGFFQCLALWPGFSRSAATILGGMLLGAQRKLAAEYSFIAAVPIMVAATGFDLLSNWQLLSIHDLAILMAGFSSAFISAWIAVKVFISLLQKMTLRPFAWYRLVLAVLITSQLS